jgi:hypothetical protein
MIRNNRITALHFVQYDVLFDFDLIFNPTFSNISAISRRPVTGKLYRLRLRVGCTHTRAWVAQ